MSSIIEQIQCACGSAINESTFKKHFEENEHEHPSLVILPGLTIVKCFCGLIVEKASLEEHVTTNEHLKHCYQGQKGSKHLFDWYDCLLMELEDELMEEMMVFNK